MVLEGATICPNVTLATFGDACFHEDAEVELMGGPEWAGLKSGGKTSVADFLATLGSAPEGPRCPLPESSFRGTEGHARCSCRAAIFKGFSAIFKGKERKERKERKGKEGKGRERETHAGPGGGTSSGCAPWRSAPRTSRSRSSPRRFHSGMAKHRKAMEKATMKPRGTQRTSSTPSRASGRSGGGSGSTGITSRRPASSPGCTRTGATTPSWPACAPGGSAGACASLAVGLP